MDENLIFEDPFTEKTETLRFDEPRWHVRNIIRWTWLNDRYTLDMNRLIQHCWSRSSVWIPLFLSDNWTCANFLSETSPTIQWYQKEEKFTKYCVTLIRYPQWQQFARDKAKWDPDLAVGLAYTFISRPQIQPLSYSKQKQNVADKFEKLNREWQNTMHQFSLHVECIIVSYMASNVSFRP